jgi:hypothetical protein
MIEDVVVFLIPSGPCTNHEDLHEERLIKLLYNNIDHQAND